jgi:hypothetical protein
MKTKPPLSNTGTSHGMCKSCFKKRCGRKEMEQIKKDQSALKAYFYLITLKTWAYEASVLEEAVWEWRN